MTEYGSFELTNPSKFQEHLAELCRIRIGLDEATTASWINAALEVAQSDQLYNGDISGELEAATHKLELQYHRTIRVLYEVHCLLSTVIHAHSSKVFEFRGPVLKREMFAIDVFAEAYVRLRLEDWYGESLTIYGEEALGRPRTPMQTDGRQYTAEAQTTSSIVLVDVIDGVYLLRHSLGNWCSSLVFTDRTRTKVDAAFIGLPVQIRLSGGSRIVPVPPEIYFAIEGLMPAKLSGNRLQPFTRSPFMLGVENACLCFVGQTPKALSATAETGLFRRLSEIATRGDRARIFNLGGNPMLTKLASGEGIDAVIELVGQPAHDFVAGAYLVKSAGAVVEKLSGEPFDNQSLLQAIVDPATRDGNVQYIAAATPELAANIRDVALKVA